MKFCKVCGSTLDTIISTRQVGCAECYFTFQDEFEQSFKNIGISFEEYEKAAFYRDYLKVLNQK